MGKLLYELSYIHILLLNRPVASMFTFKEVTRWYQYKNVC